MPTLHIKGSSLLTDIRKTGRVHKNQIELIEIFKGIIPYLGIVILTMILMYQFPGIALWLPDYLFGVYVP